MSNSVALQASDVRSVQVCLVWFCGKLRFIPFPEVYVRSFTLLQWIYSYLSSSQQLWLSIACVTVIPVRPISRFRMDEYLIHHLDRFLIYFEKF